MLSDHVAQAAALGQFGQQFFESFQSARGGPDPHHNNGAFVGSRQRTFGLQRITVDDQTLTALHGGFVRRGHRSEFTLLDRLWLGLGYCLRIAFVRRATRIAAALFRHAA